MRDYPLISDYIDAIKAAEDNFEQLKHLRPVLGADGNPVMSSGNFAVVFKMKDECLGKFYAVKCFLKEQEGREEAYRLISDELNAVNSPYLTPIRYLDKELFVDSRNTDDTEFPVLLMDWVEGTPLDKYIQVYVSRYQRAEKLNEVSDSQEKTAELIANAYELDKLSYQFSRLAVWLLKQPFAHGDLKPDNIMVKENGDIVLVDYDGMYVPAMKGQKARELGSPDFRHPSRTIDDFDEHIDDFPLSSILLSLLAIATRPALFDEFGDDGRLLFTENDYRNLAGSIVLDAIKPLIEDKNLTTYLSLFYLCSAQKSLFKESYHLFYLPEPVKPSFTEDENMSTKVTRNDFAHSWMDVYGYDETGTYNYEEYGLLYNEDKRRLLSCSIQITDCTVREGTKVICDRAFSDKNIVSIQIPGSVIAIGEEAFYHCPGLESISVPEGINAIGDYAFADCHNLTTIHLPESLNVIGDGIFHNCNRLSGIYIPKGFKSIYEALLPDYKCILIEETESEDLSTEVTEEDLANAWTDEYGVKYSADRKRLLCAPDDLESYSIIEGTSVICEKAFSFSLIKAISFSETVSQIGSEAFFCTNLISVNIPKSAVSIEDEAFSNCPVLTSISIPQSVIKIGQKVFSGCNSLSSIRVERNNPVYDSRNNCNAIIETKTNRIVSGCRNTIIPNDVKAIGNNAFQNCGILVYSIHDSVILLGRSAFRLNPIKSISLSNNLKCIGAFCFSSTHLEEVVIPEGVTDIESQAFSCCLNLEKVFIPNSISLIDDSVFYNCPKLKSIFIPKGTKYKFEKMLPGYKNVLVEHNCVFSPLGDKNLSIIERCQIICKNGKWIVKCTFVKGKILKSPLLYLLEGQGVPLDEKTSRTLCLYDIDNCESFYINPDTISFCEVDISSCIAKIQFDNENVFINSITWGFHQNINDWKTKEVRTFTLEERNAVKTAEVVYSQYGNSVCFYMNSGGQTYIPLSHNSSLIVGDTLNLKSAKLITLSRDGEEDIYRVIE